MPSTRPDPERTDEEEFETELLDLLSGDAEFDDLDVVRVSTFADAGVLTRNSGLVVRLRNGDEFQITIVQSREGTR